MAYAIRRRVRAYEDWDEDVAHPVGQTVFEEDDYPTGVLDADGNEIWRVKDPIGFKVR